MNLIFLLLIQALGLFTTFNAQQNTSDDEVPICGGFIHIEDSMTPEMRKEIDYSNIIVRSYTMDMIMKEQTNVAQSGYYFLPIYEIESFILKISGPNGMSFEPEQFVFNVNKEKRIEDICKEDNNFVFKGFIVEGQISTFGSNDGPENVNLLLQNESGETLQSTISLDKGRFRFKPIYPGSYKIRPFENEDAFDPEHSELNFSININNPNFFERALVIRGYKVSGRVEADGEALENVQALIYSFNNTLTHDYKCPGEFQKDIVQEYMINDLSPFCSALTNKDGVFNFQNIPFGKFLIKPIYKDHFITFEVQPDQVEVEVMHKDVFIEQNFLVIHFSILGKVVNTLGNGIPNVTIKIDGQVKAITDSKGVYLLERLVSGNYDLEAHADDMFFEPLTNIRITAHTKTLPDLVVTDYKLCGRIQIEANEHFSNAKRSVVLQVESDKSTKNERTTITDNQGRYCFEVKPGKYHIYPTLSQAEKDAELHLNPESIDIEVIDRPLLDINFYQSKVQISGQVKCIEKCDPTMKIYLTSMKSNKLISTDLSNDRFTFKDILSGQYRLFVKKHEWCWKEVEMQIKVQNVNIDSIEFIQSGFSLFYSSEHDIDIEWENPSKGITAQKETLERNKSKICLPYQGEYKIIPKGCQRFEEEFYMYSTEKLERLQLTPKEFLVKGSIVLNNKVLQKFRNNLKDISTDVLVEELKENELDPYKSLSLKTGDKVNQFRFYTKPRTNLIVTPVITKALTEDDKFRTLIFYPKFKQIRVEENCLENIEDLKFEMRSGLIIQGTVTPAMEGVTISAFNQENSDLIASVNTTMNGDYKIGPLYTEFKYNLKASKEGYKILTKQNEPYNFLAEKLSFLRVKVVDTKGKPLSSVFLSLSSSDRGFKMNNNTNLEGFFDFIELYSGDYYIKPLFKEYRFEPSQKLVKVLGGEKYEETIIAHRIAFSIYGKSNPIT